MSQIPAHKSKAWVDSTVHLYCTTAAAAAAVGQLTGIPSMLLRLIQPATLDIEWWSTHKRPYLSSLFLCCLYAGLHVLLLFVECCCLSAAAECCCCFGFNISIIWSGKVSEYNNVMQSSQELL